MAERDELKQEAVENKKYIELGKALASVKTITPCPVNIDSDIFYAHAQSVAPRASSFALAKFIPLAVAGFLVDLGIGG
eukprot:209266-Ditylum_brightwellii.AAC.1